MTEAAAYQSKMADLLNEWRDKVAYMETKSPGISPDKRAAYEAQVAVMRARHAEAVSVFAGGASGLASWTEVQPKVQALWKQMTNAYEKALCQFEGVKN